MSELEPCPWASDEDAPFAAGIDTPRNPGVQRAIERHGLDVDIRADRLAVVRH